MLVEARKGGREGTCKNRRRIGKMEETSGIVSWIRSGRNEGSKTRSSERDKVWGAMNILE